MTAPGVPEDRRVVVAVAKMRGLRPGGLHVVENPASKLVACLEPNEEARVAIARARRHADVDLPGAVSVGVARSTRGSGTGRPRQQEHCNPRYHEPSHGRIIAAGQSETSLRRERYCRRARHP
jgi:hypothetical protein